MWPGNESVRIGDATDGSSRTLLVVEVADSGIEWMEPRDLHIDKLAPNINPTSGQGISSKHPTGANVLFGDGHVGFLRGSHAGANSCHAKPRRWRGNGPGFRRRTLAAGC